MAHETIGINVAEIKARKRALESKLLELTGASWEREDLWIEYQADPLDQVNSSTDREMTVQRLNSKARQIQDIQAAIAKIDDGAYGLCEDCEENIPRKRLDAVPWARLCVTCQSKAEAATREGWIAFEDAA